MRKERLLAQFTPIRALGLMSGTSMDGVDAAVLVTDGHKIQSFGESTFRPFTAFEVETLTAAQGLWPGDDAEILDAAGKVIQNAHTEVVRKFDNIDLVGFHGQTLNHDPKNGRTFQLGDGVNLAARTGITTVWDFRTNDMKQGGQGAPLTPFYHFACAKWAKLTEPTAFLNLGGVANVTLINPNKPSPEIEGALLAFDTGPANAPLNDLMQTRKNQPYDKNGVLASSGTVDQAILKRIIQHPFFTEKPPKSLDRHDFHNALQLVETLNDADAASTLTALPAACAAASQSHFTIQPKSWFITGGGTQNPTLMNELKKRLTGKVAPIEEIGLANDLLEAQAFAFLAVRTIRGLPISSVNTTGVSKPEKGGQITFP